MQSVCGSGVPHMCDAGGGGRVLHEFNSCRAHRATSVMFAFGFCES